MFDMFSTSHYDFCFYFFAKKPLTKYKITKSPAKHFFLVHHCHVRIIFCRHFGSYWSFQSLPYLKGKESCTKRKKIKIYIHNHDYVFTRILFSCIYILCCNTKSVAFVRFSLHHEIISTRS